jgi:hypothetical protein
MATQRTTRTAGLTVLLLAALGLGAGGCANGGSSRTDYYAARGVHRPATAGDGSIVATTPQSGGATWSASLTFVPIADAGDFADGR